jgi:hypothetical protein
MHIAGVGRDAVRPDGLGKTPSVNIGTLDLKWVWQRVRIIISRKPDDLAGCLDISRGPEVMDENLRVAVEGYGDNTSTVLDLDCTRSPSAVCLRQSLPLVRLSMYET